MDLREKRLNLITEAQTILKNSADVMSPEDEKRFDSLMDEADKIKGQLDRSERAKAAEADLSQRASDPLKPEPTTRTEREEAEDRKAADAAVRGAFVAYLRKGMGGLTSEQRNIMQGRFQSADAETRALAEGTGASGGFLVPTDFYDRLTEAQKAWGGIRQSGATVLATQTGATLQFPMVNDTANVGAIVGENTQITELDMGFTQATLGAYTYTSKIVTVPINLLQDAAFDLEAYLARALGVRIGRITNNHFTVGTGTGQPNGVVTAAQVGKTGATGQTTSFIYDDLVDLVHSVDPAYRANAKFMLHDTTVKAAQKIKDTTGRPIWVPGLAGFAQASPDTILSYGYVINQDMPVMAANAKSIAFGDFSNYYVRDVLGVQVLRLNERYADYLQVGFLAFARHDGNLIDAGMHPVQLYVNSAT